MNGKFEFEYEADIVVCGAGTAGSIAAIAAANEGKTVAIVEQFGSPGGSGTLGLVTPLMHTHIEDNPMCSYISEDIYKKLLEYGGANSEGRAFDPQILTLVLEEMLTRDHIKIFYHTFITDVVRSEGSVEGIIVNNKSGRGLIKGRVYIDATGDGDVSYLAKADFKSGDEDFKKNQPVSLRYMLGGIDIEKLWTFIAEYTEAEDKEYDPGQLFYEARPTLDPIFEEAIEKGDLVEEDGIYWQVFGVPGRKDSLAFNCPEFFERTNAVDYEDLTYVQLEGKKAILRQLKFYKKYLKGFEDAYISGIATMVGIRESRRITTDYVLTMEDVYGHRKFDDGIVQSNYPVDIHGRDLNFSAIEGREDREPYYEIPFRSLVVKGLDNLLVAGRCIGADFVAQSSLRIIPTCRALGEASGIGAALSIDGNASLDRIDGSQVRKHMIGKGAIFT